jgi:hypothetical protein
MILEQLVYVLPLPGSMTVFISTYSNKLYVFLSAIKMITETNLAS